MTDVLCKGTLLVQEAFGSSSKLPNDLKLRPKTNPKNINVSSYKISLPCYYYVSTLEKGQLNSIKLQVKTEQTLERISGKNLYKDIKNSVCAFSNISEASKVRKRLIGLQKIHGTISDENFNFTVCQSPVVVKNFKTINGKYLLTISNEKITART